MASCSLCSSFGPTKIQYNYDLAKEHAETHRLQLKFIDNEEIDMNHLFEKCFPDFASTANGRISVKNSSGRDLIALCHSLLDGKFTESSQRIVCEECDAEVQVIDRRKVLVPRTIIEHACKHLRLNVFECGHCVREFRTRSAISVHLNTVHQIRETTGHFREKIDDFTEELSAMIKACFGGIRSASVSEAQCALKRQALCYRLIRKLADQHGNLQCRLCSKGIRTTNRKGVTHYAFIREHAYCHLPTPLYRCRICSEACFSCGAVTTHLQSAHALPPLVKNFECLADQYHWQVMATINKCYDTESDSSVTEIAFRNLTESMISRKTAQTKLTAQRQLLCHRLIRKCVTTASGDERFAQCRLCSKRIGVKLGNTLTTTRVMQHALLHLGKTIYQCKKCSDDFVTQADIQSHLKLKHVLPMRQTYYRYLADQLHGELVCILRRCYGTEGDQDGEFEEAAASVKLESSVSTSAKRVPSSLTNERRSLCIQLVRDCSDKEGRMLQCHLCPQRITVKGNSGSSFDNVMMHALSHVDKPMYRCRICSETFVTSCTVGEHVRKKHGLPMANNYDCLGDQFHAEIMEMLRKCYNKEPCTETKVFTSQTRAESCVRGQQSRAKGSQQTNERQLLCYRLVRKYVSSDGKVECLLCKKRLAAKFGEHYKSQSAMMHALMHLKKPIYRCVVCSETRPYINSIHDHLKAAHGLRSANNYECLADEYHSEILATLRECYGEL